MVIPQLSRFDMLKGHRVVMRQITNVFRRCELSKIGGELLHLWA